MDARPVFGLEETSGLPERPGVREVVHGGTFEIGEERRQGASLIDCGLSMMMMVVVGEERQMYIHRGRGEEGRIREVVMTVGEALLDMAI